MDPGGGVRRAIAVKKAVVVAGPLLVAAVLALLWAPRSHWPLTPSSRPIYGLISNQAAIATLSTTSALAATQTKHTGNKELRTGTPQLPDGCSIPPPVALSHPR